ncbi:MAG: peptidase M50, partial [Actinobacteria bacterium]|nr:peptidase M50 [Actinomycetota bacterium]
MAMTIAIAIGLIFTIMLHEAGHLIAAKRGGMKATEFFVGFGPRLWSFRRGETEYGIKAIPAGGYVRVIGMTNLEEVEPEDEARTYRSAPYKRKMVMILAGVTVNLLLAYL